jgi:metal-responsive CopG/Arc/MetJ family transcriptional regulator
METKPTQMRLSEKTLSELDWLTENTGASNRSEMIRQLVHQEYIRRQIESVPQFLGAAQAAAERVL